MDGHFKNIIFLCFLSFGTVISGAQSLPENPIIEKNVYDENNYRRRELFKEQDLIYGRSVSFQQGLELICIQDKVEVEISGYDTLYTPVDLNNIPAGDYNIKLYKTGYYTSEFRITIFPTERTSLVVQLVPYTTVLTLEGLPADSKIYINNQKVENHSIEVPIGDNYLRISTFGYEDYIEIIEINDAEEIILRPELVKKEFALRELKISSPIVWSNDSRSQKRPVISIYAEAPGRGSLAIISRSDGKTLVSETLLYSQEKTNYTFNLDAYGEQTENEFLVRVYGESDGISSELESLIILKQGTKSIWRNNFTGLSGLLFAPTAETLPSGGSQFQTSVTPVFPGKSIEDFYLPAVMSLRTSITGNLELSLGTGLYISPLVDHSAVDIFASGKLSFFTTDGSDGFSCSTGISVNYIGKTSSFDKIPAYDPFSGSTGISLVIPLQYRLGSFLFVFTPELKISPTYPGLDNGGFSGDPLYIWSYMRGGIVLDSGEFSTALSAALQTPSYTNSQRQWPLFVGLEFSMTPGLTGFSGSLYSGIRYAEGDSLQVTSGISAGFIF